MAQALDGDADAGQVVPAEPVPDGGPDAEPDPARRHRRGIAAAVARAAEHVAGLLAGPVHVLGRGPDVLARVVAPAEALDRPAERPEQRLGLVRLRIADDHGLAAAISQVGHGGLEGHAPREPEHVGERVGLAAVGPHPAAADRRAERRVMDGDDRLEPAIPIEEEAYLLVRVERRRAEHVHDRLHRCGAIFRRTPGICADDPCSSRARPGSCIAK